MKSTGLASPPPDEVYYPARQLPRGGMTVFARIDGDPSALQSIMTSAVAAVDKEQPISFFQTMDTLIAQNLGFQRIVATLTGIAAIGLYGVMAYSVAQRTSEIGIRMALGARRVQVLKLIVTQGMLLVFVGLGVGLGAAFGAGQLIASLLFETRPFDSEIYAIVAVLFAAVALLACILPAMRAAKIDPIIALRAE